MSEASVAVDGRVVGAIGSGLLVLVAVAPGDSLREVEAMAFKIAGLRVFPDQEGRMNRSLIDVAGGALVVSQFTLYGDCRKGRRPSFVGAAAPELAEPLYLQVCEHLAACGVAPVERGVFGASMRVSLVNEGPVTLMLDVP